MQVEKILSSGCRVVIYRNGTKKEISTDEKSVTITFFNGDVKQILPDGKVVGQNVALANKSGMTLT